MPAIRDNKARNVIIPMARSMPGIHPVISVAAHPVEIPAMARPRNTNRLRQPEHMVKMPAIIGIGVFFIF
jgi:hypothetical protein